MPSWESVSGLAQWKVPGRSSTARENLPPKTTRRQHRWQFGWRMNHRRRRASPPSGPARSAASLHRLCSRHRRNRRYGPRCWCSYSEVSIAADGNLWTLIAGVIGCCAAFPRKHTDQQGRKAEAAGEVTHGPHLTSVAPSDNAISERGRHARYLRHHPAFWTLARCGAQVVATRGAEARATTPEIQQDAMASPRQPQERRRGMIPQSVSERQQQQ